MENGAEASCLRSEEQPPDNVDTRKVSGEGEMWKDAKKVKPTVGRRVIYVAVLPGEEAYTQEGMYFGNDVWTDRDGFPYESDMWVQAWMPAPQTQWRPHLGDGEYAPLLISD